MNWFKKESENSFTVFVKAKPRASRSRIVGVSADGKALEIAVAAPPVEGAANEELVKFFSKFFDIKKSHVEILKGEQARYKQVKLTGISEDELKQKACHE